MAPSPPSAAAVDTYFSGVLVPKELSVVYGAIFGLTSHPIVHALSKWRTRVLMGAPLGPAPELVATAPPGAAVSGMSGGLRAGGVLLHGRVARAASVPGPFHTCWLPALCHKCWLPA